MDTQPAYRLPREERIHGRDAFRALLATRRGFIAFPLRVVFRLLPRAPQDPPARLAVSVSKRRFKRAVKRNRVKRLVREAYRLNKHLLHPVIPPDQRLDILLIYIHDQLPTYVNIEKAMQHAIQKLANQLTLPPRLDSPPAH